MPTNKTLTEEQINACKEIDAQLKIDITALTGADKNQKKINELINKALSDKAVIKQQ